MAKDDIRVRRYETLPDGRDAEAGFLVGNSGLMRNNIEVFYLDGSMASEVDARDRARAYWPHWPPTQHIVLVVDRDGNVAEEDRV
jgi:hypothetical protein